MMTSTRSLCSWSVLCCAIIQLILTAGSLAAQSPTAVWALDEGAGATAFDSSGNNHQGTLSKSIAWDTGIRGRAMSADVKNPGYAVFSGIDLRQTRAVTISFWSKRDYSRSGGVLFESGLAGPSPASGFALLPDDATCGGMQALLYGNEGKTANCYDQPSSGAWHHLAIVYDRSQTGGNAVALYVDGSLQRPNRNLDSATNTNAFGADLIYFFSHEGTSQFASGKVDELQIFDEALSATQIQKIYRSSLLVPSSGCPGGTPGCVQVGSTSSEGAQSISLKLPAAVTPGDTLAIGLRWGSSTATLNKISVSGGCALRGGFVKPKPFNGSNPLVYGDSTTVIAYGVITTGGSCTVSSTLSAAVPVQLLTVHELNVGPYECSSMNYQDSPGIATDAVNSLGCETTSAGDYLLGTYFDAGSSGDSLLPGTGFRLETYSRAQTLLTEDRVQSVPGLATATFTTSALTGQPTTSLFAFQPSTGSQFTLSATPSSLSIAQGKSGTSTITSRFMGNGLNNSIILTTSGVPSGTTVSFSPNPIPPPGSGNSTMLITVGSNTAVGTYPIVITGGCGGAKYQAITTVTLTVTAAANFSISASPTSLSVVQGGQGTSTLTTAVSGGFNSAINLSASGVPTGTTASFSPNPIAAPGNGSSTLTISVGAGTAVGTYPITVAGNGGGMQHSTTVTLTVTAQQQPDFTLSASPSSVSILQGGQGTSTLTTTIRGGFNSAINLSASGVPSGTTVSFSPNPIVAPGNGASTMTITVGGSTAVGTYPISVTGNGGGIEHTATVTLTVTAATSIAYVQMNYATPQTGQSTVNVTYTAAQTAGNLNVVVVGWNDSTATVTSVSDSKGNVYSRAVGPTIISGTLSQSIYYAKNIVAAAAGTNAVTVKFSTNASYPDIRVLEYHGADPNSPVDVSAAAAGNSNSSDSGSILTTSPTDLIFGANMVVTSTKGAGSGFTSRMITSPDGDIAEDRMVTSTGSYNASAPLNSSGSWIMQMVAFRTPSAQNSYTLSASPTSVSVVQGGQGASTITTAIQGDFNSAITLSASGMPTGTTVSFSPNPIPAPGNGASTMTINVGANTTIGTYPITVAGDGGGIQQSTTVTLTVTAQQQPNFTISVSPTSLSLLEGSQGTATITTAVSGGFNSAVSLSASGVPDGTVVSFSPNPISAPGSGQAVMSITVGVNTLQGTYPIVISGSGGGVQRSATLTLTVTGEVMLSWTGSGSQGIAGYNVYRSTTTGGPYSKINSVLVVDTNYIDQEVQDGHTYYYVTTAVNQQQQESGYSNEASATMP
jgi:hypothetical protein